MACLERRFSAGDISQVEYELFQGRVNRIRWQLAERFERRLVDPRVAHLTTKLGKPYCDQLIEGKFGSGRATFRRAAWRSGDRNLENRQASWPNHPGRPRDRSLETGAIPRSKPGGPNQ